MIRLLALRAALLVPTLLGVLVGGYVAMRTARHDASATAGLVVFAACMLAVGFVNLNDLVFAADRFAADGDGVPPITAHSFHKG